MFNTLMVVMLDANIGGEVVSCEVVREDVYRTRDIALDEAIRKLRIGSGRYDYEVRVIPPTCVDLADIGYETF